jgi:hypothetical protein
MNRSISFRLNGYSLAKLGCLLAERSLLLANKGALLALLLILFLLYIMFEKEFPSKTSSYQVFLKRKAMVIFTIAH